MFCVNDFVAGEGERDEMSLYCNSADGGGMCSYDCVGENDDDGACRDDDGDCE